jgi:general secretion pathway protein D
VALVLLMSAWARGSEPVLGAEPPGVGGAPATPSQVIERIEFRDLALTDALRLLAAQTDLNLLCSAEAGKTHVSLFLKNVPAKVAIDELCKAHNLWYRTDETNGVTRIMTLAEFQHNLTEFRDEQTHVFTLLYPNSVDVASAIQALYGDRVRLTYGADESDETQRLIDRFNRFDVVDSRSQGLSLTSPGGIAGGTSNNYHSNSQNGYSSYSQNGGGMSYNNSGLRPAQPLPRSSVAPQGTAGLTSDQAEAIGKILEQKTTPAEQQAAIAEYLRRATDIYVTLVRRNNMVIVRTSDQGTMKEIQKLVEQLDMPTPLVLLEIKVLSIDLSDEFESFFEYQFSDPTGAKVAGGFSNGDIQPSPSDFLSGAARRAAPLALGGTGLNTSDLLFQYVSNSFRARLQLLTTKNRVTTLAAPMLLTVNNEVARLFIGENRPIVTGVTLENSQNLAGNQTYLAPQIQFVPVGTTLLITPNINADRTVTLRLLQDNSTIEPNAATIPVATASGGIVSYPVDVVSSQLLSGTLAAKDGLTMAVGGLISENITHNTSSVPVLGDLPLAGIFFRRENTGRSRQELIILIQPHVLNTPAESEAVGRKLLEELSIHPKAASPEGTLNTYGPKEVPTANPPQSRKDIIFQFHSVNPDSFEK